jgi:acetyl esterase/lipase
MLKKLLMLSVLSIVSAPARAQDSSLAWAAQLETEYRVVPNITYLTLSNYEAKLDLYVTRTPDKPLPTLIWIHGGGWTGGVKETSLGIPAYLAMGMNVVNVEYRLARTALAPAAVEDCRCALRWVIQNAKQYGIDVNRLVVAGGSAGGHLALTTGMLPASAGLGSAVPGPRQPESRGDCELVRHRRCQRAARRPNMKPYAVAWLGNLRDREQIAKRVSPINYVRPGLSPILTIHGDLDPTVPYSQSVRLHKALADAGVPNELMTMAGGKHGYECCTPTQRAQGYAKIREFLVRQRVLEAPKAPATAQGPR